MIHDASHLEKSTPVDSTTAMPHARTLSSAHTFTSIPTESRKKGMNSVLPTKWMRFISGPCAGTSRLSASPASSAPTMGSTPAACAR